MNRLRRSTRAWWAASLAILLLGGGLLVVLFLAPFAQARAWMDLLSKDGSLDLFSQSLYNTARLPALVVAFLALALAVFLLVRLSQALHWIAFGLALPGRTLARLKADARIFWRDLRSTLPVGREWWLVGGLTLVALILRAVFILRPLEHDEAYTIVTFASVPLRYGLSDYHLPNNHLFHTFLVHIFFRLFGYQTWAMRMPAFLAGLALVPLLYWLARNLYNRRVALAAGAFAAALPQLIYFSTNARGYTMVMLFALLITALAVYLRKRANLLGWALLTLFSVLGLYTIPVFLFAYGMVMLWLFASLLAGESGAAYGKRWSMLGWLIPFGLATGLLTGLLYLPVILYNGIGVLISRDIKIPPPFMVFLEDVGARLQENVQQVLMGVPVWFGWLLVLGFVLSVLLALFARPCGWLRLRVPLQLAAVGWVTLVVLGLRAPPWPRFLSFLVPMLLMWASAGLLGLLELLPAQWSRRATAVGTGLAVAVAVLGGAHYAVTSPQAGFNVRGNVEQVEQFLQGELRDQDLVVVNPPHDAVLWYYSRLHGLNFDHYKRELPFFRALVLVDEQYAQTVESVMDERGPDLVFFDSLDDARVVYQSGSLQVYELIPDPELIRSAYHIP